MTNAERENAIRCLKLWIEREPQLQTYKTCLEALEQTTWIPVSEKLEPCDDVVSRQAVLDQTYLWSKDEFLRVTNPFDYLRKRINSLSSVTPQQKTGHWEYVQYDYSKLGNWHCSECRCVAVECVNKEKNGGIPLYKYCPQCGTKMVEPQESEKV